MSTLHARVGDSQKRRGVAAMIVDFRAVRHSVRRGVDDGERLFKKAAPGRAFRKNAEKSLRNLRNVVSSAA